MELLKKTMIAFLLLSATLLHAQDPKATQLAFSKSYAYETKTNYDSALIVLKAVYQEQSYPLNLRLGWLSHLAGKEDQSIVYYTKAMRLMPAATQPIWGIITPLAAQEKWTEVEKMYLAILKIDPTNSLANYRLGSIYYYRKDYVSAKKYFDVSLNQYPFDYDSLLMSAWTNYSLNNMAEAKTLFNQALLANPGDASAQEGLKLIK